jgi:hypothetical protein
LRVEDALGRVINYVEAQPDRRVKYLAHTCDSFDPRDAIYPLKIITRNEGEQERESFLALRSIH